MGIPSAPPQLSQRAITSTDIVSRLERIPTSGWHVRTRAIVGIATFFDAFDALTLAFVLPSLIRTWHLLPGQAALLLSAGFLGQLVGAFSFGALAERYGRIPTLVLSVAIFSFASLLCAATNGFAMLLVFRAVQGVGLGGEVPVAATYINELTKSHGRGRFILLYEIIFPVGLVFAGLLGTWIVPTFGWRYMFLIGALPAIPTLLMTRLLPESPRWLLAKGKLTEAQKVVEKIETAVSKNGARPLPPVRPLETVVAQPPTHGRKRFGAELFSPFYRWRTLVIWMLWFCSAFVVYGLVSWLPTIYSTVFHVPLRDALLFSLTANLAGLVGTLACALLIDRTGRRPWFVAAFICAGCSLAALATHANSLSAVVAIASISYFFVNSTALALYVYTPECYPTRIRALGTSIGTGWQRIASIFSPLIVGSLLMNSAVSAVFWLYCAAAVAGAIVSLFTTETAGRTLEELSP